MSKGRSDISITGKDLGFQDVDLPNVRECLDSHSLSPTDMDLTEWEQHTYDEKKEIVSEGEGCVSKEILIQEFKQMFPNLETVEQQIMDLDLNVERSTPVCRTPKKGN
jgi:hypothetical protein